MDDGWSFGEFGASGSGRASSSTAIAGKSEDIFSNVFLRVGVHDEILEESTAFSVSPGNLLGISCSIVVSLTLRLIPLVKNLSTQIFLSGILGTGNAEPIPSHDSASLGSIAAVAAKPEEGEVDVSLSIAHQLHARSGGIGDGIAERIMPAIVAVQSLHLSLRIEPQLSHVVERSGSIAFHEVLLEADWPNWRLLGEDCQDESQSNQQCFHLDIKYWSRDYNQSI